MKLTLPVEIQSQPTDSSCGPTCLQAIYGYWGDFVSVDEIIAEVPQLHTGGTLGVQLACHALARGYDATIYTYNLHIFDPTWFRQEGIDVSERLRLQRDIKGADDLRFALASDNYLRFYQFGGRIVMEPLERQLIQRHMTDKVPMLAGLSATFLYQESRERGQEPDELGITSIPDDVGGEPAGHFVVLSGYDEVADSVMVCDPLHPNPKWPEQNYWAAMDHVAAAILLGIVTYDAHLLVIQPKTT